MGDDNKKRGNNFRKIFPNIFFSKNKEKSLNKEKNKVSDTNSKYYQNAHNVLEFYTDDRNERIYENISTASFSRKNNDLRAIDTPSNHSSSSTLVSENSKNINKTNIKKTYEAVSDGNKNVKYLAKPQVPPKPKNDSYISAHEIPFPDVYYHSLDKLTDKIPLEQLEVYRATKVQANPASVGAEIKKVSTTFLISPKKEAEVRKIQPIRARSLSPNRDKPQIINHIPGKVMTNNPEKPYNYSAPTSPIAAGHKIPNMPAKASPYERVRKNLIEAEEKRNFANRADDCINSTLSPTPSSNIANPQIFSKENLDLKEHIKKEKTRQRVEAFYWQKIKKLREKEDEYILRHSVNGSLSRNKIDNGFYSNCKYPSSHVVDPSCRSASRFSDVNDNLHQSTPLRVPFVRGVPGRRSDSCINNKNTFHADATNRMTSEKNENFKPHWPLCRRGSLTQANDFLLRQAKRGTLEAKKSSINLTEHKVIDLDLGAKNRYGVVQNFASYNDPNSHVKMPPVPPTRTTSFLNPKSFYTSRNNNKNITNSPTAVRSLCCESESGSEASEIRRIMDSQSFKEEDWQSDPRHDGGLSDGEATRGPTRGRPSRRDDPRRHTLAGNHAIYMHQHHPGHISTLDIERYKGTSALMNVPYYSTVAKYDDMKPRRAFDPRTRKPPLPRYPPPNNALLFDDDPGVMSEVETSSTGFRRGGKQRSSLPVVRTPSKTLERPLGLVFLQYRNETKRALLPNEITSIDTVKALFVRSFPKQLTMQYMDSENVKIYIHENTKDMFYELEDVRAHLRDIRDRSVLRLFEATDIGGGVFPGAMGVGSVPMPAGSSNCSSSTWDEQNYFSEPEIDSDYHSQHVHNKNKVKAPAYYMGTQAPSTLPRGGSLLRAFSPAAPPVPADRAKTIPTTGPSAPSKPVRSYVPGSGSERCFPFAAAECPRGTDQLYSIPAHSGDGYMSSPERVAPRQPYEDPYYTQFLGGTAGRPPIAPIIDEEANETVIIDDAYQMYGVNPITTAPRPMPRPPYDARLGPPVDDMQRLRVEKMERQLANLTGLVQKALQVPGTAPTPTPAAAPRQEYQSYAPRPAPQDAVRFASNERPPKLGRDRFQKSVSFEKSVSFSDDPPDMNSPKQHSPQHSADTKPTKPAIKSSTLPRTSSQERDRLKPAPPPKPAGLVGQQLALAPQRTYTLNVNPDFFNQLRVLQKQSRDLRIETRNLRRSTLSHSIQMRQMMAETIVKIGAIAASFCEQDPDSQLTREEEIYRQDMLLLENDLYELEATVERLRGQAANRETRVNMADIERIAMVLSKSSKTVADWKLKFPILQETMKAKLAAEMEKVVRKEKMLEEEPERLELALRRCKKLTGTLVTLKRLACVQEQRLPIDGRSSPSSSQSSTVTPGPSSEEYASENACAVTSNTNKGCVGRVPGRGGDVRPENALDALLDELQTFSKPPERGVGAGARGPQEGPLRRLHSYPSGSDTDASPPVRARGQHPPKPPVPERHPELLALAVRRAPPPPPPPPRTTSRSPLASPASPASPTSPTSPPDCRQALLEQRHQELLKKQKALQEQYARLQMIQRSGPALPLNAQPDLKKTGSESNLLTKMNLNLAPASISGSMTHLAADSDTNRNEVTSDLPSPQLKGSDTVATTNKVYETDIL